MSEDPETSADALFRPLPCLPTNRSRWSEVIAVLR